MKDGEEPIDFGPLKRYSTLFRLFRIIRRVRMILVRLVLLSFLMIILIFILNPASTGFSYSSSNASIELDAVVLLFVVLPVLFFTARIYYMDAIWRAFAKKNGFQVIEQSKTAMNGMERIPSFRGKFISFSSGVITGTYRNLKFALFARQYKEGGVMRWRERQMDTILTLFVPAELPHIVINARNNERARRSNLSVSFPDDYHFRFEGTYGDKYDIYTSPASRLMTLQLFTPDVISVLYEKLPNADIEIKRDKIWIIQRYGVLDDKLARDMFEAASDLYAELDKQMKSARLLQ